MEIQSLSAISHLLERCPHRVRRLLVRGSHIKTRPGKEPRPLSARVESLLTIARENRIPIQNFTPERDDDASPLKAVLQDFQYRTLDEWLDAVTDRPASLVVALDHVQDPQNFGALCRTAEALGVHGVIIPKDRGVAVSPGAYAASAGAVESIPIVRPVNLGESLRRLKDAGYWIVGAQRGGRATPPWEVPTFDKIALVLGAEGEGLHESVEKICDWVVEIPISGSIESLNVSVAGALLMYELARPGRPFREKSLAT